MLLLYTCRPSPLGLINRQHPSQKCAITNAYNQEAPSVPLTPGKEEELEPTAKPNTAEDSQGVPSSSHTPEKDGEPDSITKPETEGPQEASSDLHTPLKEEELTPTTTPGDKGPDEWVVLQQKVAEGDHQVIDKGVY